MTSKKAPVVPLLNLSGGKDSGGMLLFAKELYDRWGMQYQCVFADTGNEHPVTLEYVASLPSKTGCPPIQVVRADFSGRIAKKRANIEKSKTYTDEMKKRVLACLHPTGVPFLDLCLWKGRFPSPRARFCTVELKIATVREFVQPMLDAGGVVESWQGIRAEESTERAKMVKRVQEEEGLFSVRPLLNWKLEKVLAIHKRHGLKLNPLYMKGMRRVGCMPCMMCGKDEMYQIARRFPEHIDRLREWESILKEVSKRGMTTFFPSKLVPGKAPNRATIDGVVKWAFTLRGGKQYDLLKTLPLPEYQNAFEAYGYTESAGAI